MFWVFLACSRDLLIEVDGLELATELRGNPSITLTRDGETVEGQRISNKWKFSGQKPGDLLLTLTIDERECQLHKNALTIPRGRQPHLVRTGWECPGLLGYNSVSVGPVSVGKSEVTQRLWTRLMTENPSSFSDCGEDCPVEQITWLNALEAANRLSIAEGLRPCYQIQDGTAQWPQGEACLGWRLATSAEWEMVATDGTSADSYPHTYAGGDDLSQVGWTKVNSEMRTHPVCQKHLSERGLCDLTGNVWEWVWDAHESKQTVRVARGGGFSSRPEIAALRNPTNFPQGIGIKLIGARFLRTQGKEGSE